jgi:hypothetical protein
VESATLFLPASTIGRAYACDRREIGSEFGSEVGIDNGRSPSAC